MNIVFMGTPDFAQKSLKKIVEAGHNILAVVTNPDKPKGRGGKLAFSEVKEYALTQGLEIYQPLKVRKNEEFINKIKALKPDVIVVVAYGKILPKELLNIPKFGSINVHGSLLPKLRGAAPIQWSVLNGDKITGITTMFMDEGMDTGDMILQEELEIGEDENVGEVWDRMGDLGADLLEKTISNLGEVWDRMGDLGADLLEKTISNLEQVKTKLPNPKDLDEVKKLMGARKQEGEYTLAPMLDKEMSKIDWNKTSQEIHNLVRGLNPIMGTYTFFGEKKIKIWKTELIKEDSRKGKPGEVLAADKKELVIATGNGNIKILELQGENAKKMDYRSFLNGILIPVGTILK